jgi:hypothetical protein
MLWVRTKKTGIGRALCAAGTVALITLVWLVVPATAGPLVDPSTLQPEPPPGAVCRADGQWTICHTGLRYDLVNEPVFDLPCGTVYETSVDIRAGIRWYNGENKLAKRFVTQDAGGSWSLSPTGAGPQVTFTVHDNWWNVYAVPGDESTGPEIFHGNGITAKAPDGGVIIQAAGLDRPDESHRGVFRGIDDPAVLCAALGS